MKKYLFLFYWIVSITVNGQFSERLAINSSIDRPNDAKCYDLDGDGDLDIISSSQNDNKIAWYKNDGAGNFGVQQIITATVFDASMVFCDDLDGDGDLDLFSMVSLLDRISWYENDGDGNFGPEQIITTDVEGLIRIYTADLDEDGDPDLISSSSSDNKIAWYENDGDGNFGSQQIIAEDANNPRSVFASDLNEDGDIDVVYASGTGGIIAWYENDGMGGFGLEQNITMDVPGLRSVSTSDFDNDGDEDVLSGTNVANEIIWYENDGTGSFGVAQIVSSTFLGLNSVISADLDNDLDFDILATSSTDDKVSWFENDGTGSFGPEQIITLLTDAAATVFTGDLDADGDPDVISTSIFDEKVAWYENDGTGVFGPQKLIVTDHDGANNVHAADMDGDGDMDVISTAFTDNKLVWYGNNGEGDFNGQYLIAENVVDIRSAFPADLDGDGDLDMLSASSGEDIIAWYENTDGFGSFGEQQIVSIAVEGARDVYAADLDGDGDIDVLSASKDDDKVAWYANDGTGIFGTQQIVTTTAEGPNTVFTADLDEDGDFDVLLTAIGEFDDRVAWCENDGAGNFGDLQIIHSESLGNGANDVTVADLDGDGDLDVLSSTNVLESFWNDKIAWYENDGTGNFGSQQEITNDIEGANAVFAADLDGDGDQDVLSTALNDSEVAWYENDGIGNFGTAQVISFALGANGVFSADLNGDGGLDVLSSSFVDGGVAWYENLACLDRATIELEEEMDHVICFGSDIINLLSDKEGGVFSGSGVLLNEFDPVTAGVGEHTIYYTRSTDEEGCAYNDSIVIMVQDLPEVTFTDVETDTFCLSPYSTVLGGVPLGGVFIGEGLSEEEFTPLIAGVGSHEMIYRYEDAFGCVSADTLSLTVLDLELPEVNFVPLLEDALCQREELILLEGIPAGGIFEGVGVSTLGFVPTEAGAGTHSLFYTYEDEEGCANSDTTEITIWNLPSVTFNDLGDNKFCLTETTVSLSGAPAGGVFSGTGVIESQFNPNSVGEGEYTLFYAYEDGNGCEAIDSISVLVVDCLSLKEEKKESLLVYPNPFNDFTTIYFGENQFENYTITIHNILGKEVYYKNNVSGSTLQIEKGELGPGIFMLGVYNSSVEEIYSTKLVVK